MTINQNNTLHQSFAEGLQPIDSRPLYEWLADNINLPNVYEPCGRFNIDFYPYLKAPMLDLTNDKIKQVNAAASTQGGKSMLMQLLMPYIILESPGPLLMLHDTADNGRKCVEERIIPLLKNNTKIKHLLDSERFSARKSGILLPHMTCRISGPAESNILGYTARYILADEIWRWEADNHLGILEKLENRQTAYNATRKLILTSQPDVEGSEWHTQCIKGFWYEWGWTCEHCHTLQRYRWNEESEDGKPYGMIMDQTVKDSKDIPDYDRKAASAHLVCSHCFNSTYDTPESRRDLISHGDYILIHKGKNESVHTYSWPQYVNRSVSFKDIALRYLSAVAYKRDTGEWDKHQIFCQQTLGQFWHRGEQVEAHTLITEAYKGSDEWPAETIRFLTLDPQKESALQQ